MKFNLIFANQNSLIDVQLIEFGLKQIMAIVKDILCSIYSSFIIFSYNDSKVPDEGRDKFSAIVNP